MLNNMDSDCRERQEQVLRGHFSQEIQDWVDSEEGFRWRVREGSHGRVARTFGLTVSTAFLTSTSRVPYGSSRCVAFEADGRGVTP